MHQGYVGNKAAVFPLQLLGFDVDPINSVQLSNHTGYPTWKGQILDGEQLGALIEGVEANGLLFYTHLLTGGSSPSILSLTHFPFPPLSLFPSLLPSLSPSFPPSFPTLTQSAPHSLSSSPSILCLTHFPFPPLSLFPSLLTSLSPSFPPSFPPSLPLSLPPSLPLSLLSSEAVLARTLQHRSPPLDGTESSPTPPTPKRLELCLVQSRDDYISPPVVLRAQAVESGVDGLDGLQDGESALVSSDSVGVLQDKGVDAQLTTES
ncbi:unnamed protein product [Closterium sp. NIES-65]|nr:unnamed protein product [Closterium sp. NIES-65]CAI5987790.1 unnamed protein product [Closterium sp. NIES-65]